MGIPKLIEAESTMKGDVDERTKVLYVSMFFNAFKHEEEKRKNHEKHEQEIINLRGTADDELTNIKERLEEALEQKLRMEKLYSELEQKYKNLQLEYDRIVAETNLKISGLEAKKSEWEQIISSYTKELEELKDKYNKERQKSLDELETLRKILLQHLSDLSKWKGPNQFSIQEASANRVENELTTISDEDQLAFLMQQFQKENTDILDLWKQKSE